MAVLLPPAPAEHAGAGPRRRARPGHRRRPGRRPGPLRGRTAPDDRRRAASSATPGSSRWSRAALERDLPLLGHLSRHAGAQHRARRHADPAPARCRRHRRPRPGRRRRTGGTGSSSTRAARWPRLCGDRAEIATHHHQAIDRLGARSRRLRLGRRRHGRGGRGARADLGVRRAVASRGATPAPRCSPPSSPPLAVARDADRDDVGDDERSATSRRCGPRRCSRRCRSATRSR